ncbi:hypothetical protein ACFLSI_06100 [Bacteroidota bacterium]
MEDKKMIAESKKTKLLAKELIKKAGIESPSNMFTSNIMNKLGLEYKHEYLSNQSIITKKVMYLMISIIIASFFSAVIFLKKSPGNELFEFGKLPKLKMPQINIDFTESLKSLFENADYLIYLLVPIAIIWMYIIMDKILKRYFRTS